MNEKVTDGRKKTGKLLIELSIAVIVVTGVIGYGYYQSILNNWKIVSSTNLFFKAFIQSGSQLRLEFLNQESLYIYALSVFFSFLGNKEELVFVINLILQIAGMIFFCLGAKKIFSFANPLIAFVISGVLSVCFYSSNIDSPMHVIWFFTGILFWLCSKLFLDLNGMFLKHIFIGVLLGVFAYADLAAFILILFFVLITLLNKQYTGKEKALQILCFFLCIINGYFVMFYLWNNFVFNTNVFLHWLTDRMSFVNHKDGICQYLSLAILMMISVIFYLPKNTEDTDDMIQVNIDTSSDIPSVDEEKSEAKDTKADDTTKETPIAKPIKFIENPLPLPKKHVKKEMNYAFEPSEDQMHYDYNNYTFDDDYDLKDI